MAKLDKSHVLYIFTNSLLTHVKVVCSLLFPNICSSSTLLFLQLDEKTFDEGVAEVEACVNDMIKLGADKARYTAPLQVELALLKCRQGDVKAAQTQLASAKDELFKYWGEVRLR
jgi:hypothetical protein